MSANSAAEKIVQAKGEILDGLSATGTAVLNRDDKAYPIWAERVAGKRIVSFGLEPARRFFRWFDRLRPARLPEFRTDRPVGQPARAAQPAGPPQRGQCAGCRRGRPRPGHHRRSCRGRIAEPATRQGACRGADARQWCASHRRQLQRQSRFDLRRDRRACQFRRAHHSRPGDMGELGE